jgi:uncharacterized membrane protein
MVNLIKTTILGGMVFLIPIVVLAFVIGKGLQITTRITGPIVAILPEDTFIGPVLAQVLAVALLIAVCFLFGLLAKRRHARRVVGWLETNVLERVPAYLYLKSRAESALSPEEVGAMRPVVVRKGDAFRLGFEVDRVDEELAVVFLPDAPDTGSGHFAVYPSGLLAPLDISLKSAATISARLGAGSGRMLDDAIRALRT